MHVYAFNLNVAFDDETHLPNADYYVGFHFMQFC